MKVQSVIFLIQSNSGLGAELGRASAEAVRCMTAFAFCRSLRLLETSISSGTVSVATRCPGIPALGPSVIDMFKFIDNICGKKWELFCVTRSKKSLIPSSQQEPQDPISGSQISDLRFQDLRFQDLRISGSQISGFQISGFQISGSQISRSQISGFQISGSQISGSSLIADN